MSVFSIGGELDIGTGRERQEDYFRFNELDETHLLCILADGTGSREENPRPAAICVEHILSKVQELYGSKKGRPLFKKAPEYFLKLCLESANEILGGFRFANEELYSGYAASLTCALFSDEKGSVRVYAAHAGNTRLSLLRDGMLRPLTRDHTRAMDLVREGKIDMEQYYTHPGILNLTSGLGIMTDPQIQTVKGPLHDNDICIMTTDGIHYAIRQDAIAEIVLNSESCEQASANLIAAARELKYPDNASAVVITRKL